MPSLLKADRVGKLLDFFRKYLYVLTVLLNEGVGARNRLLQCLLLLRSQCVFFQLVLVLVVEHRHISAQPLDPNLQALLLRREVCPHLAQLRIERRDVSLELGEGLFVGFQVHVLGRSFQFGDDSPFKVGQLFVEHLAVLGLQQQIVGRRHFPFQAEFGSCKAS